MIFECFGKFIVQLKGGENEMFLSLQESKIVKPSEERG